MSLIKIAIADDHPLVISGLQNVLPLYPHIILEGIYSTGAELLAGLQQEIPDVLLLDIQLPDKTGDELVSIISKKYPLLKILTLTNFNSTLYVNSMLTRGAHGYILKTSKNELLVQAIETVYRGEQFIEPAMKERIDLIALRINKRAASKLSLTLREKEIIQCIAQGDTSPEIAEKLFLSIKTIDHYRTNIMIKLDVTNATALVVKALKMGLVE